jgi:hypothetical protein
MLKRIVGNACATFDKWTMPDDIAHVVLFRRGDNAKVFQGAAAPVYGDQ